ncbi:CerR family C-terminal domain-containing protein [Variovorax ginsengisoli]|uniref:AcrR family transcriptional regulator n=1 Tax=Variovorax ginsengisoli TaxID=363844 RepID=A0ABT9SGI7_9BURK|nr:CerR family C-terminal domain-containing protein [Variovorax ginsengisoli]MDP9902497.1 AcrR family transcriptional regulator [Variovorax ginsengisoli]
MKSPISHAIPAPPASRAPRASRSDGIEARGRLLHAALRLFAEKGFAKTSTREIAQAAGANVAAISYYFGDKAGLYAATFCEPMGGTAADVIALFDVPGMPVEESLHRFMLAYTEPLKLGEVVGYCMRLHMRELLEPTQQFSTEIDRDVRGPHEALVRVLCRHLALDVPDDDVHRLALSIAGLAMQLFVMRDIVDALQPSLLGSPQDIDAWAQRLLGYALAMVASEAARRRATPAAPRAPSPPARSHGRSNQRTGP